MSTNPYPHQRHPHPRFREDEDDAGVLRMTQLSRYTYLTQDDLEPQLRERVYHPKSYPLSMTFWLPCK